MGWFEDLMTWPFGGNDDKSQMEGFTLPDWKEDPDYRKAQDYLSELGINILEGDIPDYYKGIGEAGGSEFDNYLNLITGDLTKSTLDTAAATGRGGGAVQELINKNVGEFTTKSRYADFLRALEGKSWLFGQGRGITEGARGAGQTQQAQQNQFNLNRAGLDFNKRSYLDAYTLNQDSLIGDTIGELLGLGVNAGVGYASSGGSLAGAVAGAMGGVDWEKILEDATKQKVPNTTGETATKRIEVLGAINPNEYRLNTQSNPYLAYI